MAESREVVMTGSGWVTPLAAGFVSDVSNSLHKLGNPEEGCWRVPDEMRDRLGKATNEIKRDRGAWLAALAVELALEQSALNLDHVSQDRLGSVTGWSLAGQDGMIDFADEVREQSARFVSPLHFPQTVGNFIAGALARCYHIRGPNVTVATADTAGFETLAEAFSLIRTGLADVVLAGGVACYSDCLGAAFARDRHRATEGAACVVLENGEHAASRNAPMLGKVKSVGTDDQDDQLEAEFEGHQIYLDNSGAPGSATGHADLGQTDAVECIVSAALGAEICREAGQVRIAGQKKSPSWSILLESTG